jgi:hypothetical protein
MHKWRIRVNQLGQTIEPLAEQWQHPWDVVLGYAAGLEQDVDAGTQFKGTRRYDATM